MLKIVGYGDRFSVAPGETIRFMVSTAGDRRYRAELLRIIHGDCNPQGPGFKAEQIASPLAGSYQGREQEIHAGSYVRVPHHECFERLGAFTPDAVHQGEEGGVAYWYSYSPPKNKQAPSLRVWVDAPSAAAFRLTRENWFDRLGQSLGIALEIKTGDDEFDRAVYITTDYPQFSKKVLAAPSARQALCGKAAPPSSLRRGQTSLSGAVKPASSSPTTAGHSLRIAVVANPRARATGSSMRLT